MRWQRFGQLESTRLMIGCSSLFHSSLRVRLRSRRLQISFAIVALIYPICQNHWGRIQTFGHPFVLRYIINISVIKKIQGIFGGVTCSTVLVEDHVP